MYKLNAVVAISILSMLITPPALAEQTTIEGPPGSRQFGTQVVQLDNGNVVITDPQFQSTSNSNQLGAVYLYRPDGTKISRLTGTTHSGFNFRAQVIVLRSGNFLVRSSDWGVNNRGALTWCSSMLGCDGAVSAVNSLVGASDGDRIAEDVVLLKNGNFVVVSPRWSDDAQSYVGAVTWGSGTSGVAGPISATNSLIGGRSGDQVGIGGVVPLDDGGFVVSSSFWRTPIAPFRQGALTRGSGVAPLVGRVSAANSFLGSVPTVGGFDGCFSPQITELEGGRLLVADPCWNDGPFASVGAVTWFGAGDALIGSASVFNSLIGTNTKDGVGARIAVLQGGQYAVGSQYWRFGRGAVTLSTGANRLTGRVSATNSLVGSTPGDQVGQSLTVLTNGNLVVASPNWDGAVGAKLGAVSFVSAATPITGPVTRANSLYSVEPSFFEPDFRITPLRNGNYVVGCAGCTIGGHTEAGVVVFASGSLGITGPITTANSLHGVQERDSVGQQVLALSDGNYLVLSPEASRNALQSVGAASFGDGQAGIRGAISPTNSLVGSAQFDRVGTYALVLDNGAYVVASPYWANGAVANAGAVTHMPAQSGVFVGVVSALNSLVGTTTDDQISNNGIMKIAPARIAISSANWSSANASSAGAVTLADVAVGLTGPINGANSLIGSRQNDQIGYGFNADPALTARALQNGYLLVRSPRYQSLSPPRSGAVSLIHARAGQTDQTGELTPKNSVFGDRSSTLSLDYNPVHGVLLVGMPEQNQVILFRADALFKNGFEP